MLLKKFEIFLFFSFLQINIFFPLGFFFLFSYVICFHRVKRNKLMILFLYCTKVGCMMICFFSFKVVLNFRIKVCLFLRFKNTLKFFNFLFN